MSASAIPPLPPPPTSVKPTTKERVLGGVTGFLRGATGQDPNNTPMDQAIARAQAARLDEARMHRQDAANAVGVLATGYNPTTRASLTPAERTQYENRYKAAMGLYEKAAGTTKETKGAIAKMRAIADHLIGIGAQKQAQGAPQGALAPPPSAQGSAAPPQAGSASPSLPAPPSPSSAQPQAASQPSPPARDVDAETQALAAYNESQQKAQAASAATEADVQEKKKLASQGGLKEGTPEYNEFVYKIKPVAGQNAVAASLARQGYNATFNPDGTIADVTPIPGFKNPQREKLVASLALRGETPQFDDAGNVVGVTPIPGFLDFQKSVAAAKQGTAKNAGFMTMYAAYRFYDEAIRHNPNLLPYVAPMIKNALSTAGVKTPEGFTDALSQMPPNMPVNEFGKAIGIQMPGSPIAPGAVNQGGLYAQRFLKQEPEIRKEIADNAQWLGPVHGRVAVKYLLYKVGSTGNKDEDRALSKLRTNLELTDTNVARMHINSVKAIQGIEQLSDAGKMSPDALLGALDSIHDWAQDAALQGEGKSVFAGAGASTLNKPPKKLTPPPKSGISKAARDYLAGIGVH